MVCIKTSLTWTMEFCIVFKNIRYLIHFRQGFQTIQALYTCYFYTQNLAKLYLFLNKYPMNFTTQNWYSPIFFLINYFGFFSTIIKHYSWENQLPRYFSPKLLTYRELFKIKLKKLTVQYDWLHKFEKKYLKSLKSDPSIFRSIL